MKKAGISKVVLGFSVSVFAVMSLLTAVIPSVASAAPITATSTPADCSQRFLTFPTWFRGLVEVKEKPSSPGEFECMVVSPDAAGGLSPFIWHIVLNVIEIGLQLVIYAAVGFILFGGFQFLTSGGSPEAAAKSRQTIINAAIGIAISFGAIAAVNLISGVIIR